MSTIHFSIMAIILLNMYNLFPRTSKACCLYSIDLIVFLLVRKSCVTSIGTCANKMARGAECSLYLFYTYKEHSVPRSMILFSICLYLFNWLNISPLRLTAPRPRLLSFVAIANKQNRHCIRKIFGFPFSYFKY